VKRRYATGGVILGGRPWVFEPHGCDYVLPRLVANHETRVQTQAIRLLVDAGFTPSQAVELLEATRPTCACGDRGTHRPEPGVGCTRPGCLCLEPGEPAPRPPAPPDTSWLRMERIR
jgi:hypothetical protein